VADTVEVISRTSPDVEANMWVSNGTGEFEISTVEDPGFARGTKITMHLKDEPDCIKFTQ